MTTQNPQTSSPAEESAPVNPGAYRLAFNLWLVLFLLVICVGLLNFLGTVLLTSNLF